MENFIQLSRSNDHPTNIVSLEAEYPLGRTALYGLYNEMRTRKVVSYYLAFATSTNMSLLFYHQA